MQVPLVRIRQSFTMLTISLLAVGGALLPAQTVVSKTDHAKASQISEAAKPHPRAHLRKKSAAKPVDPVVEAPPPPPPPPNWPANAQAVPAKVGWNGRQLEIAATNSSLLQILHDVSTATGVKVEGLNSDQRIFGSYGPADPRDVLAKLLEGSGYNVLMIGDQGTGTPRQILLTAQVHSAKPAAGGDGSQAQPNGSGDDEPVEDQEPPEQPMMPNPQPPPFTGGPPPQQGPGPGRTPQQLIQELQERQQQQLQQQQQQQPPEQPEPQS